MSYRMIKYSIYSCIDRYKIFVLGNCLYLISHKLMTNDKWQLQVLTHQVPRKIYGYYFYI